MNWAFGIPWLTLGLFVTICATRVMIRELGDPSDWVDPVLVYGLIAFGFFMFWILGGVILCLYLLYLLGRGLVKALA